MFRLTRCWRIGSPIVGNSACLSTKGSQFSPLPRTTLRAWNPRSYTNFTNSRPRPGQLSGSNSSQGGAYWKLGIGAGTATSAVLFTKFDEQDSKAEGTREAGMLAQSVKELREAKKARKDRWLIKYIVDPFMTWLRFLHISVLFLPVFLSMPLLLLNWQWINLTWYRYLTTTLELAGPTFIKLGQWAASRGDIFPKLLCDEFSKLHSNAKQHNMAHTRKTVSHAFGGRKFEECFIEFDEKPLGVGAMGQVYRAKPSPDILPSSDGQDVAVKVLHPHIETMVERDLTIMSALAYIINGIPTMEWLSLPGEVEVFGKMMRSQLDLRIETENLRIFDHNFASTKDIEFPKCYPEVSTREVLVEELVVGVSMEKVLRFCQQTPLDRRIATLGLDAFLKMLLLDNFIHSDLHAGNIIVKIPNDPNHELGTKLNKATTQDEWNGLWDKVAASSVEPSICFIDAGLVTELDPRNRDNFVALFKAIATFNGYKAGQLMVERSRTPETTRDPEVFALKTQKLVSQVKQRTFALGSVKLGDLLTSMLEMVRTHHVRMESDFVTVVLSILLLEGIGRRLNPDLDIFKSALPILRKVSSQQATSLNLKSMDSDDLLQMAKVWLVLEGREFINASIQDIYRCIKYDRLSPNQ